MFVFYYPLRRLGFKVTNYFCAEIHNIISSKGIPSVSQLRRAFHWREVVKTSLCPSLVAHRFIGSLAAAFSRP